MAEDLHRHAFPSSLADNAAVIPKTLRILLADDDEINREIVAHLVAELPNALLVTAADGRGALEFALTQKFDLLIFDLNMPEINGDRLIRHLRASQSINATSPMILFTAWATGVGGGGIPGSVGSILADMILPKPIRADEFMRAIRRLTRRTN